MLALKKRRRKKEKKRIEYLTFDQQDFAGENMLSGPNNRDKDKKK